MMIAIATVFLEFSCIIAAFNFVFVSLQQALLVGSLQGCVNVLLDADLGGVLKTRPLAPLCAPAAPTT